MAETGHRQARAAQQRNSRRRIRESRDEITRLVSEGHSYREIGRQLGLSAVTVIKYHRIYARETAPDVIADCMRRLGR